MRKDGASFIELQQLDSLCCRYGKPGGESSPIGGAEGGKLNSGHALNIASAHVPYAQIFIGIILLLLWSENLPPVEAPYQFFDVFAGVANATREW